MTGNPKYINIWKLFSKLVHMGYSSRVIIIKENNFFKFLT
nr:MAG TPA: hypothetical protein [Caudoviricetes sp.]